MKGYKGFKEEYMVYSADFIGVSGVTCLVAVYRVFIEGTERL